ncbi:MAG: LuxR C-terminal-related transcriptional regulator [Chloroflexota bacterium]|nr:LuxR C-terminal-related transcriptional regulator [Chloroflexota bacterium]
MLALEGDAVEQAAALAAEALTGLRGVGDAWSAAEASVIAAEAARRTGATQQAAALYVEALAAYWEQGDQWATTRVLDGVAAVAASEGLAEAAVRLAGSAVAAREAIRPHVRTNLRMLRAIEAVIADARQALGEAAFARAWATGQELPLEVAVTEASALGERLMAEPSSSPSPASAHATGLSAREAEVLRLVAAGLTNAEIGERLFLSPRTVGAHVYNIYRKVGVSSRGGATRFAAEHGLA